MKPSKEPRCSERVVSSWVRGRVGGTIGYRARVSAGFQSDGRRRPGARRIAEQLDGLLCRRGRAWPSDSHPRLVPLAARTISELAPELEDCDSDHAELAAADLDRLGQGSQDR